MKSIIRVENAECPRGGTHVEGVSYTGQLYCLKCLRPSAVIDAELNDATRRP